MHFFKNNKDNPRISILLLTVLIAMCCFVFTQPYGDGPDEINRYKVVTYIQQHGHLPKADSPEILIDGYGASYAFQPMLTYIIEGYLLYILTPLHLTFYSELIIARMINVLIGLCAAFYTYKLSKLLFNSNDTAFLFAAVVALLPQNIFIYTYVNTDGMGLLSIIMILYGLFLGYKTDFNKRSYLNLAFGIVLCLMSYYNCYGCILVAFIAFIAYFVLPKEKRIKEMFIKGGIIAAIVIVFAGWWFIRNAILYHGDLFALTARAECAAATGNPIWLADMANTYQVQGYSLPQMIFKTDYFTLVWKSFIAMFGPMSIPTHNLVYIAYILFFVAAVIGLCIPNRFVGQHSNMPLVVVLSQFFCLIIPAGLALFYSYTWDYQPQGRYYLPCLIPLAYFLCIGMEKLIDVINSKIISRFSDNKKALTYARAFMYHILYLFFFISLIISVLIMIRYYASIL